MSSAKSPKRPSRKSSANTSTRSTTRPTKVKTSSKSSKRHPHERSRRPPTKNRRSQKRKAPSPPRKSFNEILQEGLVSFRQWMNVSRGEDQMSDQDLRPMAIHRLKIIASLVGIGFIILLSKASYVMLLPNEQLEHYASAQFQETNIIRGRRGNIYDRNEHLLASSVLLHEVIISSVHIPEKFTHLMSEVVARHLNLDQAEVAQKIREKRSQNSQYLVIAKRVPPKTFQALEQEINDIYKNGDKAFRKEFKLVKNRAIEQNKKQYRIYPGKSLAAQLLGGVKARSQKGAGGLEYQYDHILRGEEFATIRLKDAGNRDLNQLIPEEMAPQAQDGQHLRLTIDSRIQHITDQAIAKAVEATGASTGFGVVVDVKTGEILASSTQPAVNINKSSAFSEWEKLKARSINDSFEAGSVFKPLLAAAALNEGLFTPYSMIDCRDGYWKIHGIRIRDKHCRGEAITVTEAIQHSSNIGAVTMNLELGAERSLDYLNAFGFGNPTDLNFPGETAGKIPSHKEVKPYHLVTMSYGYALTSSITQLTMAYASLGNKGKLMKPILVKEILNSEGEVIERFDPTVVEEVIRPNIAKQTIDMMKTVVGDDGTAKLAQVSGYSVAGKTGTAEKAIPGGYSKTDAYCTFIGLIPADDPQLAIGITIDTPTIGLAFGGVAAGPAFADIAGESMKILNIPPDPKLLKEDKEDKKQKNKKKNNAENAENAEDDLLAPPPEIVWTEKGEIIMPNLQGLTLRDFLSTLQVSNMEINFEGSGRVVEQYPSAGELITRADSIRVKLQ